jgi:hypothetical protein
MLKLRTPKLAIAVVAFCAISVAGFSTNWTNVFAAIEGFGSKVEADAVQPVDVRPANMLAPLVGTYNIPGDYPTLDAAITDLNAKGLGGAVTLNLLADNPQTAPAGGYVIGGSGSVLLTTTSMSNIVSIVGNGNTITASSALTAGNLNDAIFKLVGADWVTISGFTMTENSD